jgi:calpain
VVLLYKNGGWRRIRVDDAFPTDRHQRLLFVRSKGGDELWPMLLEKAYAAYYGGYGNIEGGFVHVGLVDLTGGFGEKISLRDNDGSVADEAVIVRQLEQHSKNGDLIGAGSTNGRDTDATPDGIVKGHAYAILRVEKVDGLALVQLRNPWGESDWSGR